MALKSKLVLLWILLVVITLLSWETASTAISHHVAATLVLILAFFKVRIIGLDFMELKTAPWPMRIGFDVWVVGVLTVLITLYWRGVT
jgi:hypothetical protein